jgi:hypothetical protein
VAETDQLAVNSPVAPARILAGHPHLRSAANV